MFNNFGGGFNLALLLRQYLDNTYTSLTSQVLTLLAQELLRGTVGRRFDELDAHARNLEKQGRKLLPDDAIVRALRADMEDLNNANVQRVQDVSRLLALQAAEDAINFNSELVYQQMSPDKIELTFGVKWGEPDPKALAKVDKLAMSQAYRQELARMAGDNARAVGQIPRKAIELGWSPIKAAREMRRMAQDVTVYQANNFMRTTQLEAYRQASQAHMEENAIVMNGHQRISALDSRTCMACIALHGQMLKIDEKVVDHHQGRCTSIPILKGFAQAPIANGRDWFNSLPEDERIALAGPQLAKALENDPALWDKIPVTTKDPIYGTMLGRRSNTALGINPRGKPTRGKPKQDVARVEVLDPAAEKLLKQRRAPHWGSGLPLSDKISDEAIETFQTPDEVIKFIEQKYDIEVTFPGQKRKGNQWDIEQTKEWARILDRYGQEYPHIMEPLKTFELASKRNDSLGYAQMDGSMMGINQHYFSARNKRGFERTDQPRLNRWVVGDYSEIESTISHEFGHLIDAYTRRRLPFGSSFFGIIDDGVDIPEWNHKGDKTSFGENRSTLSNFTSHLWQRVQKGLLTKRELSEYATKLRVEIPSEMHVAHVYLPENKRNDEIRRFSALFDLYKNPQNNVTNAIRTSNLTPAALQNDDLRNRFEQLLALKRFLYFNGPRP